MSTVDVGCTLCGQSGAELAKDQGTATSVWQVYDGEEAHIVSATGAADALAVLAEAWGDDTLAEYLAEPGVWVRPLSQERALAITVTTDDDDEDEDVNLYEEWLDNPVRRILASTGG